MRREKSLKVSFAKYDKNDRPWNDLVSLAANQVSESVEREEKCRKAANGGRSFKEVVEGLPHHKEVDDRTIINPKCLVESGDDQPRMELVKLNLKGMVWRMIEEIFKSTNMEEIKHKLGVWMEEVINVIQREEIILTKLLGCKKIEEESCLEGKDEQPRVFLEEELVSSMRHKDQRCSGSLIGAFEYSLQLEASNQGCSKVGPKATCVEEAKQVLGPGLEGHSTNVFNSSSIEMGLGEPACCGPECPPGFEEYIGETGLSNHALLQCAIMDNLE